MPEDVEIPNAGHDCIGRRDVFLPVQTGHCSNLKIDISVVARDGYS